MSNFPRLLLLIAMSFLHSRLPAAEQELPSIHELIEEARIASLTVEDGNPPRWPLQEILTARAYLGETAAVLQILSRRPDDISNWLNYLYFARIEIERTGAYQPLPRSVLDFSERSCFMGMAAAFAYRGQDQQALAMLKLGQPTGRWSPLGNAAPSTFWIQQKKPELAIQVLRLQSQHYPNGDSLLVAKNDIERLVVQFKQCAARDEAVAFCKEWETKLRGEQDLEEWGDYIGKSWARLGRSWNVLDDKPAAEQAFAESLRWLEADKAVKYDPTGPLQLIDEAESWAILGARQSLSFGKESAALAYERAYENAAARLAADGSFYGFTKILRAQLEAGDLAGARATIDRITPPAKRAEAWVEFGKHLVDEGNFPEAKLAAEAAANQFIDYELKPAEAAVLADIAVLHAAAGEKEHARRMFTWALALSKSDGEHSQDQWIACAQVRAGLFADAYRTIQAMPPGFYRTLPLAELAREVAKSEARAKLKAKP